MVVIYRLVPLSLCGIILSGGDEPEALSCHLVPGSEYRETGRRGGWFFGGLETGSGLGRWLSATQQKMYGLMSLLLGSEQKDRSPVRMTLLSRCLEVLMAYDPAFAADFVRPSVAFGDMSLSLGAWLSDSALEGGA